MACPVLKQSYMSNSLAEISPWSTTYVSEQNKCAGSPKPLLYAYSFTALSHDTAQIFRIGYGTDPSVQSVVGNGRSVRWKMKTKKQLDEKSNIAVITSPSGFALYKHFVHC